MFKRRPKTWQVYAQSQTLHLAYIMCEHRWFWAAEMCSGWKRAREGWFYDIQCRAGCRMCVADTSDKEV